MNKTDPLRVLLIEDNPSDVRLLQVALADAGVECELFVLTDGADALQWLADYGRNNVPGPRPRLAVVDLNIPKHDGFEILAELRRTPGLADLPVLVLSSSASPKDVLRVEAVPLTRYLRKPRELDEYELVGSTIGSMLA